MFSVPCATNGSSVYVHWSRWGNMDPSWKMMIRDFSKSFTLFSSILRLRVWKFELSSLGAMNFGSFSQHPRSRRFVHFAPFYVINPCFCIEPPPGTQPKDWPGRRHTPDKYQSRSIAPRQRIIHVPFLPRRKIVASAIRVRVDKGKIWTTRLKLFGNSIEIKKRQVFKIFFQLYRFFTNLRLFSGHKFWFFRTECLEFFGLDEKWKFEPLGNRDWWKNYWEFYASFVFRANCFTKCGDELENVSSLLVNDCAFEKQNEVVEEKDKIWETLGNDKDAYRFKCQGIYEAREAGRAVRAEIYWLSLVTRFSVGVGVIPNCNSDTWWVCSGWAAENEQELKPCEPTRFLYFTEYTDLSIYSLRMHTALHVTLFLFRFSLYER